jgi:phage repressor protein C with HTH and peptisase S24 domain
MQYESLELSILWRYKTHRMNDVSQRLKALRADKGFGSGAELARAAGIPEATYRAYENGVRELTPRAAQLLAEPLACTWQFLLFGKSEVSTAGTPAEASAQLGQRIARKDAPPPVRERGPHIIDVGTDTFALVPVYDARASAGPGRIGSDDIINRIAFRSDWLRTVTRAPVEDLAVLTVDGDSMEPTLRHNDTVLIDLTQRNLVGREGIYVIRIDEWLQVKRVAANPVERTISLGSDNPAYPTFPGLRPQDIDVLGRVIWLGRQVAG